MEEIQDLAKAIRVQGHQLEEIKTAVSGNDRYGQRGIKHDIQDLKDEIRALKDDKKGEARRFFKWIGITAVGSCMITIAALKLGMAKLAMILLKILGL